MSQHGPHWRALTSASCPSLQYRCVTAGKKNNNRHNAKHANKNLVLKWESRCWKTSLFVISSMCFPSNLHDSSTSSLFHRAKNSKYATESVLFSRSHFKIMVLSNGKRSVEHLTGEKRPFRSFGGQGLNVRSEDTGSRLSQVWLAAPFLTLNDHSSFFLLIEIDAVYLTYLLWNYSIKSEKSSLFR